MLHATSCDLLVVGGGINGAGIARDAAGRGLKTLLVEQADLASATSSTSSKLIHGGLRYLEHYEFRLVRESLQERDALLAIAPHIARPMRFVLPHPADAPRPAWLVRLGLFLYDSFAFASHLPRTRGLDLRRDPEGAPLRETLARGFAYSDCWVDDARLVVGNVLDAARRGAAVMVRTRMARAEREGSRWRTVLLDAEGGEQTVTARAIVNAAGPWTADVLGTTAGVRADKRLTLVKGSHIVVPADPPLDSAYILQNIDRRVVFVIPFEEKFNLIGTTDVPYRGDPTEAACTPEEAKYLCDAVARYFRRPPTPADVVWSFAGVRPLLDDQKGDPSKVTRDYALDLDGGAETPPLLTVFGGKLTTYRRLAEKVLARLEPFLPGMARPWTAAAPLPGGDFGGRDSDDVFADLARAYPGIGPDMLRGIFRRHGTLARDVLGDAKSPADLGTGFGGGLFEREVDYFRTTEWARAADDVLWRRTKCGLHMSGDERAAFAAQFN